MGIKVNLKENDDFIEVDGLHKKGCRFYLIYRDEEEIPLKKAGKYVPGSKINDKEIHSSEFYTKTEVEKIKSKMN